MNILKERYFKYLSILLFLDVVDNNSTVFFCVYCLNQKDSSNSFSGTIRDVYEHWFSNHIDESISKPFQFHAVGLASCFHCNKAATYDDLVEHHKKMHSHKQFLIVDRTNREKCGICNFKDGDLVEHFILKHNLNSAPNVFNPVYVTEEKIVKLLKININKKQKCSKCNQMYNTHREFAEHHAKQHSNQTVHIENVADEVNAPIYLVCGYCEQKINCNQLLSHFKCHSYNFCCSQCSYQSVDLADLVFHEKTSHDIDSLSYHCSIFPGWIRSKFFNTNMVFRNGLVLKTFNVRETKFDDSKLFKMFIDDFLDLKKERAKQMFGLNKTKMDSIEIQKQFKTSPTEAVPNVSACPSKNASNPIPNDYSYLVAELAAQRRLGNNIFVVGIHHSFTEGSRLHGIIHKLWNMMKLQGYLEDIEDIYGYGQGVVVKIRRKEIKAKIIRWTSGRYVWSYELFDAQRDALIEGPGQGPRKVSIHNHLTPFYFDLWQAALVFKKKRNLNSIKLTENGLVVKRTENSKEQIILSKTQLINFVEKK